MIPLRHIDHIKLWRVEDRFSGKDMVQPLHRHSFYYVLALKEAAGEHHIDFTPYKITDNSIFLVRPGQVHELTFEKPSTGYLLQFAEDFYPAMKRSPGQLFRIFGQGNFCALDAERSKKLFSILALMLQEYNAREERYLEVIRAGLEIFFIELSRQCSLPPAPTPGSGAPSTLRTGDPSTPGTGAPSTLRTGAPSTPGADPPSKNSAASPSTPGGHTQERLEALLALIERHIATHKEVAWYAAKLRLTPYQLNAATKTALGKTCSKLIDDHVVLEAKRHLLATSNQVKQIADGLGYEDVSYFIRFFRKHTGYSPESFRQRFG